MGRPSSWPPSVRLLASEALQRQEDCGFFRAEKRKVGGLPMAERLAKGS